VHEAPEGQTQFRRFYERKPHSSPKWDESSRLADIIAQDKAITTYLTNLANRRRNNGEVSRGTRWRTINSLRHFLQFVHKDITPTALTELIQDTKQQHKNDDYSTDDALLAFVSRPSVIANAQRGAYVKAVFKANRCPLQASFNTSFTHSTKKISAGILKAIYDSLNREHQTIIDLQAYAGERVQAICTVPIDQWEDFDDSYTLVHIHAKQTKARNEHICIIPRTLAKQLRETCEVTKRNRPFPNYDNIWREITKLALKQFGTRLTSHYLRKRFHTISGKTPMPVNEWDYLMGDKQTHGHNAGTYTLEDFSGLVKDYDQYLAPYLSIENPREPDEPREPTSNTAIEQLLKENSELKEQLIKLTKLLTEQLSKQAA
jgi:integrase